MLTLYCQNLKGGEKCPSWVQGVMDNDYHKYYRTDPPSVPPVNTHHSDLAGDSVATYDPSANADGVSTTGDTSGNGGDDNQATADTDAQTMNRYSTSSGEPYAAANPDGTVTRYGFGWGT